jgi:hypothetical protein
MPMCQEDFQATKAAEISRSTTRIGPKALPRARRFDRHAWRLIRHLQRPPAAFAIALYEELVADFTQMSNY